MWKSIWGHGSHQRTKGCAFESQPAYRKATYCKMPLKPANISINCNVPTWFKADFTYKSHIRICHNRPIYLLTVFISFIQMYSYSETNSVCWISGLWKIAVLHCHRQLFPCWNVHALALVGQWHCSLHSEYQVHSDHQHTHHQNQQASAGEHGYAVSSTLRINTKSLKTVPSTLFHSTVALVEVWLLL